MTLQIQNPGALSLLQDLGRYGFQNIGVTSGGPMDAHAFHWANRLLDNSPEAPQIEITMGPFQATFMESTSFSLCGAKIAAKLNAKAIASWQSWQAKPGDVLEIGYPEKGLRTYLAVKGGFKVATTLGSVSTVVRDQFGGLSKQGHKLSRGDLLPYEGFVQAYQRAVPKQFIPTFSEVLQIGVLPTYQFHQFSSQARDTFFSQLYTVTPQIDRMGYRLSGTAVKFESQSFVSEGIALGAIQIPANGQPIVLMRDRQTIGGYPKMGCVCLRDLALLAQATPGTKIQFFVQDIYEAEADLHIEQYYFFSGKPQT
ncbi:MAG: biotin-dependent carboxyltransferase family protein [Psychromonas sp.]